jgi:hypothetical protein
LISSGKTTLIILTLIYGSIALWSFAQPLRYTQKIILGISTICLQLFFSHALTLDDNPHKSTESLILKLQKSAPAKTGISLLPLGSP